MEELNTANVSIRAPGAARFGVNLMPHTWVGRPPIVGSALKAHRTLLLDRMHQAGIDHVMVGDHRREVLACGVDPRTRGRRMDEALYIVRRLLAGESVTHDGEFFQLDQARLGPTPAEPVPLVVGGRSEALARSGWGQDAPG